MTLIEMSRIYISISLLLLTLALILHLVAMGHPRWKLYEHREMNTKTISIGIFRRCETYNVSITSDINKVYSICDDNKYYFPDNTNCITSTNPTLTNRIHFICNRVDNPCQCDYSSITKGLISCTIIAACTLSIALILTFLHVLINQYQYKIHLYISAATILLLFIGFIFILITLIILASTMSYDLYQYGYSLNHQPAAERGQIIEKAAKDYHTRLEWAGILEILALIITGSTLLSQIIYLISLYRNRIG